MRIALSIVFALLVAILGVCAFISSRSRKPIGKSVALLMVALMPPVIGNLCIIASPVEQLSLAGCYIYFLGMDLVMMALVRFTFDYCSLTWHKKAIKLTLYIILTLDMIQLLVNIFTHHAFVLLEPFYVDGNYYYSFAALVGQTIHRVVDYVILGGVLVVFVVKTIITPKVYSEKYLVILLAMVAFGGWQTYSIINRTQIDYSMIGFAVFGVLVFLLAIYYRPLRLMDRMLAAIASKMSEALIFFDKNGRCIWANNKAYELLNIEPNELYKVTSILTDKIGDFGKSADEWTKTVTTGEGEGLNSYAIEKHAVADHKERVVGFYLSIRDNSEEQRKLMVETYNAKHDALTKIFNRAGFDALMEQVVLSKVFLVLIDGDSFKQINDQYGHAVGDKSLIKITDSICSHFRDEDFVCRIGGDEFAVIMPNVDDHMVGTVGERINNINRELTKFARDLPPTSISAGGAYGRDAENAEELFNNADHALYETKFGGKCGFTIFKSR